MAETGTRIGVFGWGLVAPGAADVATFERRLDEGSSWLSAFEGFGPSNFLVGQPDFDFEAYRGWIDERFPPSRFPALRNKFGKPTQYAIGAFIQALGQNPGVEQELRALGTAAQCIIGCGLHDLPTYHDASLAYDRAQRFWDRFWADPAHNRAHVEHLEGRVVLEDAPPVPEHVPVEERDAAERVYWAYWAARSLELRQYLAELGEIEGMTLDGTGGEAGKAAIIKKKRAALGELRRRWDAPVAPWDAVTADCLWNIGVTPAAELSMLGHITGMCFAPFAACSAFGTALKLGMEAIRRGEARMAVIGATEPPPHPLSVGTFYTARVLANDGAVSRPLTQLRGTHVSGGACVWIIGDLDYYTARGFRPLGMEPVAVGVSADADHIITPSVPGPSEAIRQALAQAGIDAASLRDWDLHATGTPGDLLEVETARKQLPASVCFTARKGTFGHGMGAGGGWELTAQYLGHARGRLFPTGLPGAELNPEIAQQGARFVLDAAVEIESGPAGKLSMGIGGINACVVSRPLEP